MVLVTPLPTKLEDFPKPVDMSSKVSTLNNAKMEDASLEEIPTLSSSTAEAPGPSSDAPPTDAAQLWEEANKAPGDLLTVKSSINAHWQKLVLEFSMALHQNDCKAMESIKEAKAIYALCPFYPGSGELLFCGNHGGGDPKGFPGCLPSTVTPQNCSAP